jgi:aldose 1-epimerase
MVTETLFGKLEDGRNCSQFRLVNKNGAVLVLSDYGARIVSLLLPDRNGALADVVLGYDRPAEYEADRSRYFGATIGRCANRIGGACFTIDGREYRLTANNATNTLHGGPEGFDRKIWNVSLTGENSLEMSYLSPDMEEGFPSNLKVAVEFTWTDDNSLNISYRYSSDGVTVANLTNHAYFNLFGSGDVLGHELTLPCSRICESTAVQAMTGRYLGVDGTPFDFRSPRRIGERIDDTANEQIRFGLGYDHAYVIDSESDALRLCAEVYEPKSGRLMKAYTDLPSVQLYTGNYLDGVPGKGGAHYPKRGALCLETQFCPDAVNFPQFASPLTEPGREYRRETVYAFSVR